MANYDGDITLTVDLEPGDIQSVTEDLQERIQEVVRDSGKLNVVKGFKQLQTSMVKATEKADKLLKRMHELEGLEFESEAYTKVQNAIESLEAKFIELNKQRKELEESGKIDTNEYDALEYKINKVYKQSLLLQQVRDKMEISGEQWTPGEETQEYANLTQELNTLNNQMTISVERAESLSASMGRVPEALSTARTFIVNFGSAVVKVASILSSTFVTGLKAVVTTLARVATSAAKASANLLKMVGHSIVNGIRSLVSNLGKLASSLNKTHKSTGSANDAFKKGIKTLIKYGFGVRSFFFLWRKMRRAVGEGIGNLAQYSDPFNQVISNLISSLTLLKNAFATAFAPIINVVAPILSTFIDLVAEAVTKIGMLIAVLTGNSTFIRAKKVQEDYAASLDKSAGSTNGATKAAKEYQKTIAGFDDVEILKEPDSGSGSGGSGGGASGGGADVNDMFETVNIPDTITNWADKIKKAWEEADFTDIGKIVGEKLADALNKIEWESLKEKAGKFGTSVATFINGLVSVKGLDTAIGQAVGEAINTGLTLWEGFVGSDEENGIAFDAIGAFIAEGMNTMTITVDWDLLAKNIIKSANGVFNLAETWAGKFKFKKLGNQLSSTLKKVFTGFNYKKLKSAFGKFGKGLANFVTGFFENKPLTSVSVAIGGALDAVLTGTNSFISNLPIKQIGEDLASAMNGLFSKKSLWYGIANTLSNTANSVFKLATTWSSRFDFAQLGTSVKTIITSTLNNLNWDDAKTAAGNIASGIAKALNTVLTEDTFSAVGTAIGGGINASVTGIKNFVSGIKWKSWGEYLSAGINAFFKTINWTEIGVTFDAVAQAVGDAVNSAVTGGHTFIKNITWDDWGKYVGNSLNTFFKTVNWGEIGITFGDVATGVVDFLADAIETIDFETVGAGVADAFKAVPWDTLFTKAGELVEAGAKALEDFLNGLLKNLGQALIDWFNNNVPQEIKDFVNGVIEAYKTITGGEEGAGVPTTGSTGRPYGAGTIREGYEPPSNSTATVTIKAEKDKSYIDNVDNDYDTTKDKPVKATADGAETPKWNNIFGDSDSKWKHVNNKTVTATADGATTTNYDSKITGTKNSTGYLSVPATRDVKVTANGDTTTNYNNKIAGGNDRKDTYVSLPATRDVKVTADGGTTPAYDSTIKGTTNTDDGSYTNTKDKTVTVTAHSNLTDYYKTTIKDPNNPKAGLAGLLGEQSVKVTADARSTNDYKEIITGEKYKNKKGKKVDKTGLLEIPSTKTSTVKADASKTKDFTNVTNALNDVPKTKEVLVKIKGGITSSGRTALKAMVDIEEGATQSAYKNAQNVPTVQALGGAFFRGAWHSIAQYAAGGIPRHGTMFVAGEAGAEAVGHIHGRTEVLNQSQMAAVMYSAVVNGTASLVKVITSHMSTCTNATIANIGNMISYLNFISNKVSKLDNIEAIIANATRTGLTDIVIGKVVPVFSGINDIPKINNALNRIVSMLQYNQDNQLTEDAFAETMTTIFRQYMNISFYLGDEQLAKHANAGNRQLEMRFNPVAR